MILFAVCINADFCALVRVFEFNLSSVHCVVNFWEISASSTYGTFSFHQFVFYPALRFHYFRINETIAWGMRERERERERERILHTLSYGMP